MLIDMGDVGGYLQTFVCLVLYSACGDVVFLSLVELFIFISCMNVWVGLFSREQDSSSCSYCGRTVYV